MGDAILHPASALLFVARAQRRFHRYADLFSDEEERARQRAVQDKRREWKQAQAEKIVTMPKRVVL